MPNWKEVLDEIQLIASKGNVNPLDEVRRKYLHKIYQKTGRNVIAYYSGWLQKKDISDVAINDKDKNALMVTIHKMDRSKGLDLLLHTPGGEIAATESIVDYIKEMFGNDVRAIIPQISMSAGTMIALSTKEIMMGKQSNLGPIDPQMGGLACQAIIDEFKTAVSDIQTNSNSAPLWQVIISKYHPTLLGECQYAIEWSEKLVGEWLDNNMCIGNSQLKDKILKEFSDHESNKSHARHISRQKCKQIGVTVIDMEDDNDLQDLILTTHHAFMHTFNSSMAYKIVENQLGIAYIESLPPQQKQP